MNLEIIGFIAGILVCSAHIPQVYKSIKTKRTTDISLPLYSILWVGVLLWLLYGYIQDALAVFVMNFVTITFISTMIFLKLKYGMEQHEDR